MSTLLWTLKCMFTILLGELGEKENLLLFQLGSVHTLFENPYNHC